MKKSNDKIDALTEKYRSIMANFDEDAKRIFIYRATAQLANEYFLINDVLTKTNSYEDMSKKMEEHITALVNAAGDGFGLFKPLMVSTICQKEEDAKTIYKNALGSYKSILNNARSLSLELGLESPLELSNLFTYLLWNGYFSVTKEHCYDTKNRLLIPSMYSFDVIKGRGVCLAYAEFLNNYLTVCGFNSAILSCMVPTKKGSITYDYRPNIERKSNKDLSNTLFLKVLTPLVGGIINNFGNHAVTAVEKDGNIFIYDPTNLSILEVLSKDKASLVNGKGVFDIKPFSSLIMEPNSDPNHVLDRIILGEHTSSLSLDAFKESFEMVLELVLSNQYLLEEYYLDSFPHLELISKEIDKYGGNFNVMKLARKNRSSNR